MPEKPPSRSLFFRSPPIMFLTLLTALMGLFVVILLSTFRLSSPAQRQNIKKPEAATQALISLPKASTWSDEEQVTSSYMPTTPLVADVSSSYPNKEVSYINSDGKLVIYAASGGNPIVTTGVVAGGMFGIDSSEFAPSAIKLDSDNYYEILVPGRVGTTWEGTLKAFRGDGSAISGLNTSFVEGIPLSAPLVDDLDADGNPEIILPVYHNANATTRLLGWTWNGSQLTGLNSGNKVLITVSGSGGFVPRFTSPASGNITSTSSSSKEVAAAVENPDGTMSIYVFRKNGSATVQVPTSGSWYQEAINEPVPGTSSNGTNPGIGGIAMVDLGGDAKQEIVIVTHKQVPSNPWGGYVVRVFNHNSSQGSGQTFATKLQTNIVNSIYLPSSRPAIGSFQGQSKAIVFNTVYNSGGTNTNGRALFAAYYNGSNLQWINGYSPRTITYKDSSPCNIKLETGLSSVTLGDGNNNGANEAFYSKFFTYISPSYYYTLYFYNAEGAPTDDPNCTQALDHYDASSFTNAQNPGGINLRIESMSNLELADIDGDGLLEMATTYSYPSGVNRYNRLYVYDLSGPASSAQDSPMAGGNECRQGRYKGVCPPAPGGPTSTPTRTPTPTIEPKYACSSNSDCVCGIDPDTSECAFLNNNPPRKSCSLPNFCTGFSGNCDPACLYGRCIQYCPSLLATPTPTTAIQPLLYKSPTPTRTPTPTPSGPRGLSASCGSGTARFSWNSVSKVNYYILRLSRFSSGNWALNQWVCVNGTSATRTIDTSATYSWSVQSSNSGCTAYYGATDGGIFTCSTSTPVTPSKTPTRTPTPRECKKAVYGGGFINTSIPVKTGTFTAFFEATPNRTYANMLVGLSNGAASGYTSVAAFIRFNQSGNIDARNGGIFTALSSIPYLANSKYRFRLVVNISNHTYSAYVTPPGQSEKTIGTNLKFRSKQNTISQLNNWTAFVTSSNSTLEICNFSL